MLVSINIQFVVNRVAELREYHLLESRLKQGPFQSFEVICKAVLAILMENVARGRTSTGWRSSPAKTAIGGSRFWSS